MKKGLILLILLGFAVSAWSQDVTLDKKEQRELNKQQKKAAKAEEAAKKAFLIDLMVNRASFVLEANMIFDHYGHGINVSSNINYLSCDSITGVIQIGHGSYIGRNGLGGITIEGQMKGYTVKKNEKRGYYDITYSVSSNSGNYDVVMTVSLDGHADATVRSNWPGSIRYTGDLVLPSQSRTYKGTPEF